MIIDLAKKHRCPAHIVHLASASAVPMIAAAQADGVPITAETCLHYLTFASEEVADGATHFKCAPPIRDSANREGLWRGLEAGTIGTVVSDHSPCTPPSRGRRQATSSARGAASRACNSASRCSGHRLGRGATTPRACSRGTRRAPRASRASRTEKAGWPRVSTPTSRCGRDAHTHHLTIDASQVRHRHKVTPYAGRTFTGVVEQTWVRGRLAYDRTAGLSSTPVGSFLAVRR